MSNYYFRKRTIAMPEVRARQIALAAAESNVSSEEWIQAALTAALVTAAENNDRLALMFARAAGMDWEQVVGFAAARAERKKRVLDGE